MQAAASWLEEHAEDHTGQAADMNQYWYSASTITTLVDVVREHCLQASHASVLDCAFVSTPSLFYALDPSERVRSRVLDYDTTLGTDVVPYDYHKPTVIPAELVGAFHCVVIDPPSITADVWRQYIDTARHLLTPSGGLVVLTTVIENAPMLEEALGARPNTFLPSIPNLPYQYAVFTNFRATQLDAPNPEVPHDPVAFLAAPRHVVTTPAEAPLRGAGHAYDFEAMLEAELQRQGAAGV